MKTLSLVIACYNEAEALPIFYQEINHVLADLAGRYRTELLFIDDGSSDDTLHLLKKYAKENPEVKYLSFSRNFGKEAAMLAGLEHAKGDFVAVLDADLQDPPSLLPEMLQILHDEDYDCVATRRTSRRGEPPIRSFFAELFYKLINSVSKVKMVPGARDFRLMTRQMVNAIISCPEYNRYSKGLWQFVGFKTKWLSYDHVPRAAGATKWSFWKLFLYAIDGIVAYSTAPLVVSALLGVLLCFISFIVILIIIIKTLIFGDPVSGWPSLACLITFIGGLQLFFLGVIGEYLAKTYLETKNRPKYIIREDNLKPSKKDEA